jgi:dUTP pyrophosphatase
MNIGIEQDQMLELLELNPEDFEVFPEEQRRILGIIAIQVAKLVGNDQSPEVKAYVLPGGRLPETKSSGAAGYDAYARAIVDPRHLFEKDAPYMRLTLADFENPPTTKNLRQRQVSDPADKDRYGIRLPIGASELVGLGFCSSMDDRYVYWVAPRSGLSARGISLTNAPGTVDADYRGEAGALVTNRGVNSMLYRLGTETTNKMDDYFTEDGEFIITHGLRVSQIIFQRVYHPEIVKVGDHGELDITDRSASGFGSTGLHE